MQTNNVPPSVAALRWRQTSPGGGGNFPVVHVAGFAWNEWQPSRGLGGNLPVDWVAEIRGIRIQWVQSLSGEVAARERVGHGPCAFSQLFLKGKVKSTPISGATSGAFFVTPKPLFSFSTTFLLRE